jgi:acyl-CoA reductase-like NAD-dependent aldehyde dehydrogenase
MVGRSAFTHRSPYDNTWQNVITYDTRNSLEIKHRILKTGLKNWSNKTYSERSNCLLNLIEILKVNKKELIDLVCLETGKLKSLSESEFEAAIRILRMCSAYEFLPSGDILTSVNSGRFVYDVRSPHGIALLIFPSNAPLPNFLGKIAPALMAGNVVFAKPSPYTGAVFGKLLDLLRDAGIEEEFLQRLDGEGEIVREALELGIDLVSFTGSTRVGSKILSMSSGVMPKIILECGGQSSLIVLPSANLIESVKFFCDSAFSNTGQRCVAAKRALVHDSIFDDFQAAVVSHMESTKFGLDIDAQIGPMCSSVYVESLSRSVSQISNSVDHIMLGYPGTQNEFTFQPRLLIDKGESKFEQAEELYGPVSILSKFACLDEASDICNASEFRLSAAVWTKELMEISYFKRSLMYGVINFNGPTHGSEPNFPFGGFGLSGNGIKDSGWESIEEYSTSKVISIFESGKIYE